MGVRIQFATLSDERRRGRPAQSMSRAVGGRSDPVRRQSADTGTGRHGESDPHGRGSHA
ncbi:hypothetical protein [Amycolatopsis sp. NPDC059021]|uniref:hypothetical protein n=1 Tax=Amycolatopsis sp. NPDC059021 TaxID=3346704 RepID=UPI0036711DAD